MGLPMRLACTRLGAGSLAVGWEAVTEKWDEGQEPAPGVRCVAQPPGEVMFRQETRRLE